MRYFGMTNIGLTRKSNQDSYVIATNEIGDVFAVVCDGIGGARGGDIASHTAVSVFSKSFSENHGFADEEEVRRWLIKNTDEANRQIYQKGQSDSVYKGMGTTLCGVLICRIGRFVINVGDSRVYATGSDGRFRQLTTDHTLVEDMVHHGELTRAEALKSTRKNVLTNALGVWQKARCDIDSHPEEMTQILICSDGLHGYVSDTVIRNIVQSSDIDPSLKARKLIRCALKAGGYDNVTVILIDLKGEMDSE